MHINLNREVCLTIAKDDWIDALLDPDDLAIRIDTIEANLPHSTRHLSPLGQDFRDELLENEHFISCHLYRSTETLGNPGLRLRGVPLPSEEELVSRMRRLFEKYRAKAGQ